jgi:hypothetical protein
LKSARGSASWIDNSTLTQVPSLRESLITFIGWQPNWN